MSIVNGIHCVGKLTYEDMIYTINCNLYDQIMLHNTFRIPEQKPDIESVISVNLQSKIIKSTIIRSIEGFKIIFHGIVEGLVTYVAKAPDQPVHSAHFSQKFHSFIKCMKVYDDECKPECESEFEHECESDCDGSYIKYHDRECCDKKLEDILDNNYIIKSYIEYIEPELINDREIDITTILLINIHYA